MAINPKDYKSVAQNLKLNKKNIREFLFDFRVNEKQHFTAEPKSKDRWKGEKKKKENYCC